MLIKSEHSTSTELDMLIVATSYKHHRSYGALPFLM
jgi:hypothetical protein